MPETTRPFAATLQEIGNGALATDLADQLQALTQAVQETGKKGTLALTITVAPIKPGQADTLVVTGEVKAKPPVGENPSAVFFPDAEGNLRRDDPNQPTLPLRELNRKAV